MRVRLHTPHVDGQGCTTPKPPALTAAIKKLDGKEMDVEEAAKLLRKAVPDSTVAVHVDWIRVSLWPEQWPGVRQLCYRAIMFDVLEDE